MEFKLTKEQIETIQLYFIAGAFKSLVQRAFEKWEQDILDSGTYQYDDFCYTSHIQNRGFEFPEDRILRKRKDLCWIGGRELYGTPEYETGSAGRFNSELKKKAMAAGYKHAGNALVAAQNEAHELEYKLVDIIYDIHKKNEQDKVFLSPAELNQTKLKLYSFVTNMDTFEPLRIQFHNERLLQQCCP